MATTDLNPNPTPKPLFLRARDLPFSDLKVHELCKRAEQASGVNTVEGAQLVNGLWRIFAKTDTARTTLLLEGISLRGHAITVTDVNPYRPVDSNGRVEYTTRLTISDIPMHLPAAELEDALSQVGCDLRSKVLYEMARDERGNLSRFKTGNRFVYMIVPETPLPKTFRMGIFNPRLFYKEQPRTSTRKCFKCLQSGHIARECINEQVCRTCFGTGHKAGDPVCTLGLPEPPTQEPSADQPVTPVSPGSQPGPASPAPIPGKSPVASLPGSPTSSRPASPGPDVSSKPAASCGNSGKRPFSPPTPSAESQDSKRERPDHVTMEQTEDQESDPG